jgi:hypothetical protein
MMMTGFAQIKVCSYDTHCYRQRTDHERTDFHREFILKYTRIGLSLSGAIHDSPTRVSVNPLLAIMITQHYYNNSAAITGLLEDALKQ